MASLTSPTTARNRFDLERLADELAAREDAHAGPSTSQAATASPLIPSVDGMPPGMRELPVFRPLAHDDPYLTAATFDVEAFLLSRTVYTALPDLRSELRDYLAALKEELVRLINDDYEAFISLSTDLRDEGATLERLKFPLGELKERILVSRRELQAIQDDIQEKLRKRARLRDEKSLLHLLLKISESVSRLETLLLIAAPSESGLAALDDHQMDLAASLDGKEDKNQDGRSHVNRAKHLARVAAEYTQLLYHVSKAQLEKSAFVDEIQWRVDRIKSTLTSDLDHLFATTVLSITDGKEDTKSARATEAEKARWMSDLVECLKTYDVLHLWRDAEDVLRRELVRDFAKNAIFSGALAAPQSPIVPHTPFLGGPRQFPPSSSFPPRTPYTPFTAFASKQNPFDFNFGAATMGAVTTPWLDDLDDPLAALYNKILRFVERDLKKIMEAAERVCVKSGTRARAAAVHTSITNGAPEKTLRREEAGTFDIMANVVWAEVGKTIMEELGSVVFAAGKPEEFRKHHETTQAFIRSLEFLAPSVHAIEAMRAHPTYSAFERRWQLPVYFQLRWKEIVNKLEVALSVTRLETAVKTDQAPFVTPQAAAVWAAITTCWSAEVYIPELAHRFWKFTLQLLSRYKTWLEASLPPFEPPPKFTNGAAMERSPASPATPALLPGADGAVAESTAADTTHLRQFAAAIIDIRAIELQVMDLWQQEIGVMLPEGFVLDDSPANPEDVLKHALSTLARIVPPLSSQVVILLTRQCCDAVAPVKSLPAQVRMSKRPPSEPSHFVPSILRPVKSFFGIQVSEGPAEALRDEFLKPYTEDVFESVCKRYVQYLASWKKTEESLRRFQRGQKTTFSLFGSARTTKDDKSRDDERIRTQMTLDVDAFGKDAESLGVNVREVQSYASLLDMVNTSLTEGTMIYSS